MKPFFERLKENTDKNPDLVILRSSSCTEGITYRQLDEMSGRVCTYLRKRNIGKGDFVTVLLPREVSAYISVIGIWKSGAAMTLLEENYSPERTEYICKDLNSHLTVTKDVYDEMMRCEVCEKYEIPDRHDACYVTYTSGSTGNPKGILHEFGKLDMFDYDYRGELRKAESADRFAVITPLNFGPSIRNAVTSLMYGRCLYIVPRDTVKNPKLLNDYFTENRITDTSATASFAGADCFTTNYLKNIFIHSEPANGIFFEGPNIINLYTLSEVVFPIFTCRIDRAYSTAPVGLPNNSVKIRITGDDGTDAKPNEIGEIAVEDPYTRGYINLPEKTAEVFRDGFFYTGDLGYYDENGVFFLCGRNDDMIKINGNRIEPAEIESNVRKCLGVDSVISKGFAGEERSFIAVYLIRDELKQKGLLDTNGNFLFSPYEMKQKLDTVLPSYMIPSYYIVLESFPKNPNGKLSRKDLPEPDAVGFIRADDKPRNDAEAFFCRLFARVLKLGTVGANDDFYEIGGDSLSTVLAISLCEDFELTATDIFNERTPHNLAKLKKSRESDETLGRRNKEALSMPQPVLPASAEFIRAQTFYPEKSFFNLKKLWAVRKNIDLQRLKKAVDTALRHHPVFSSVIKKSGEKTLMYYDASYFRETQILSINEKELNEYIENSELPFGLFGSPLYRSFILQTEIQTYYFLEIHHAITDGMSLKELFGQICRLYEKPDARLPEDYCYLLAKNITDNTADKKEAQPSAFPDGISFTVKPDEQSRELTPASFDGKLKADRTLIENSRLFGEYGGNVFFLTCFLMTLAEYNATQSAFSFWEFGGRTQRLKQHVHGLLCKTFPAVLDFSKSTKADDCFNEIRNTVMGQISDDGSFPCADFTDERFDFSPSFIYQKDIVDFNYAPSVFEKCIPVRRFASIFSFQLIDNSDEPYFRYIIKYAEGRYNCDSVSAFGRMFEKTVGKMLSE